MPLELPTPETCSFCAYLAGTRPYTILEHGPLVSILVTFEQRGLGHLLVIPTRHCPTIVDVTTDEAHALLDTTIRAAAAIIAAYDPDGVAVWQNNGVSTGQSVPHVHFHVAGSYPGRGTEFGKVPRLAKDETDAIATRLRPHLKEATQ